MRQVIAALGVVLVAFALAWADGERGLRRWLDLRSDLREAQARIAGAEAELEARRAEAQRLRTDPFALESAIRSDLGWARPGEIVVRFRSPSSRNP